MTANVRSTVEKETHASQKYRTAMRYLIARGIPTITCLTRPAQNGGTRSFYLAGRTSTAIRKYAHISRRCAECQINGARQ